MRVLEEEGVVRRKRGIGTLICDTHNLIRSTLDINESVSEMILGKGMNPGSKDCRLDRIYANQEVAEKLKAMTPLGRMAEPSEIASVVLMLLSPSCAFVTGEIVEVNGGLLMR